MSKMKKAVFVGIVIIFATSISGCMDSGQQTSLTKVFISDAPSENFSHINITFSQVKIHLTGDENTSGWIIFDSESTTVDMIDIHEHNLSELLGVKNLSVGNYSKLWIVVDSATGVLKENGEEIIFDVPSGDLKIQQQFSIANNITEIDVEIDLDRSILYIPISGIYKLTPVIQKIDVNNNDE